MQCVNVYIIDKEEYLLCSVNFFIKRFGKIVFGDCYSFFFFFLNFLERLPLSSVRGARLQFVKFNLFDVSFVVSDKKAP